MKTPAEISQERYTCVAMMVADDFAKIDKIRERQESLVHMLGMVRVLAAMVAKHDGRSPEEILDEAGEQVVRERHELGAKAKAKS